MDRARRPPFNKDVDEALPPRDGDFIATLSHELRTPLTTLTGFAEILVVRSDALPPELVAEFGRRMWRASRWLSRMTADLLDLAELQRGTLQVRVVSTDVESAIVDATSVDVRDPRPVHRHVEPGLPAVLADPARLRQVLGNLLSNARKFSPTERPIEVVAAREQERVAVTVRDAGRGIAPEELDRIFDPFVQTDPTTTRAAGGLGTGLFLVRELCERMEATVRVQSTPGIGSRFTVLLKAAEELPSVG